MRLSVKRSGRKRRQEKMPMQRKSSITRDPSVMRRRPVRVEMTKKAPQSNRIEWNELYIILVGANFPRSTFNLSLSKWILLRRVDFFPSVSGFAWHSVWTKQFFFGCCLKRSRYLRGSMAVLQLTTQKMVVYLVRSMRYWVCVCVCPEDREFFRSCSWRIPEGDATGWHQT